MTKEQEEAIERLNRLKTIKVLYTKTFAMTTEQLKVLQEDIETVLNMLKENSADIEQKNTEIAEKNAEIEKKDKIIDLMAESFAEEGFYSEHCQTLIDNEICPNDCDKCVKQYFERKARDGRD